MKKLFGNTIGLKANQIKKLENFYRRRTPSEFIILPEFSKDLTRISNDIKRQIGILINRAGKVTHVIVGTPDEIYIPDLSAFRLATDRLNGLRCVHTHLKGESLSKDDFNDLAFLRLDLMAALTMDKDGIPLHIHMAHILPGNKEDSPFSTLPPFEPSKADIGCNDLILALESEIAQTKKLYDSGKGLERALLVSVTTDSKAKAYDSLCELEDLAKSSNLEVCGTILQQRKKVDPKFLLGRGKLAELNILALQKDVKLIIFDQELNPSQIRSITDQMDLKVLDRTQLILDIFAQRAQTREGKLQVELAQLKYMLPRLIGKNTALSRLAGGIGGRGPGETKLEIDRRRIRDRIAKLDKDVDSVSKHRKQQKTRRNKKNLPVISIVGYTNAGKSTLLNTMTQSKILAENRLFATLDPTSRRMKFPRDVEVIITDTVGFIRDLPKELVTAFRATLEELENADILLHVVDISNSNYKEQIKSVEKILMDLDLYDIPVIYVLNKMDLIDKSDFNKPPNIKDGIFVSAKSKTTLLPLIESIEKLICQI